MAPVVRKAKRTSTTARGKPASLPVDLDTAFQQRLQQGEKPDAAAEGLNAAIRAGKIQLYCDGQEVKASWFAGYVHVVINLVRGRAVAEMAMLRGVDGWPRKWTVSGNGMEPNASQSTSQLRRPPGRRPTRNWQEHVRNEIIRAFHSGKPMPSGPDLAQSCLESVGHAPDVSAMNKLIKDILR